MTRTEILKAVKLRLKFMDTMSFPAADNFNELIEMVESDSDLISQFKNSDTSIGELKTILVGLCANIIYYLEDLELNNGGKITIDELQKMFPPKKMENPLPWEQSPWPNSPNIFGPASPHSPQFPGTGDKINLPWGTYCGVDLEGKDSCMKIDSYINGGFVGGKKLSSGKLSDGSLREGENNVLTFEQKRTIIYLSKDDPACKNGLTRIVTEFKRPDILKSMEKLELRGRAYCLGFIASLCHYDMEKIDAVLKAHGDGIIHRVDIINEIVNKNGTSFNVNSLVSHYKNN